MDRLYYQTLTVPAGTAIGSAVTQAWPLEDNQLKRIDVTIPDGHCGLTGFRIMQSGTQIVPFSGNSYIVANNEHIPYEFDDQITSTGLVLEGYNTDIFSHTFYVRAIITNLTEPGELPEAAVTAPGTSSTDLSLVSDDLTPDSILDESDLEGLPETSTAIPPPSAPTPVTSVPPKIVLPKPKPKPKPKPRPVRR